MRLSSNVSDDHFIYKFGNIIITINAQFDCVKNRDEEYQMAFGRHVRKLRDLRGWSQEQLAAVSNIDVNQISRIENGKHAVTLHTIRALAVALGVYPGELLSFRFRLTLNVDFQSGHQKSPRLATTAFVNKLADTEFFSKPRSVADIIAQCRKQYRVNLKSSAVSGALAKLVQSGKLKRLPASGQKNRYLYQKRK